MQASTPRQIHLPNNLDEKLQRLAQANRVSPEAMMASLVKQKLEETVGVCPTIKEARTTLAIAARLKEIGTDVVLLAVYANRAKGGYLYMRVAERPGAKLSKIQENALEWLQCGLGTQPLGFEPISYELIRTDARESEVVTANVVRLDFSEQQLVRHSL